MYYTYIYLDPRKPGRYSYKDIGLLFEPIYVGKGKNNRYKAHLFNYKKHYNPLFGNKLNKIINCGLEPIYIIRNHNSEELAINDEVSLISLIGRKTQNKGPLLNLTNGGDGISGHFHSASVKAKISIASKARILSPQSRLKISQTLKGHLVSNDTRKKISKACKGNVRTKEQLLKSALSNTGQKRTPETKRKISIANSGSKNWKAKAFQYRLIDPYKNIIICNGNLTKVIKSNRLVYHTLMKNINSDFSIRDGRCKGWKCEKI